MESVNLPGGFNYDPADRLIVATARLHGLALVTADQDILEYAKAGYVKAVDASL